MNKTEIRKALIDSRFHHDETSALECCYNSSEIPKVKRKNNHFAEIPEIYNMEPHIDLFENGEVIIPQRRLFPKSTEK